MDIPSSITYRSVVAHTPLGGSLGFRQMNGSEGLSQLFDFDVELVADNYNLDLKSLLGKPLTLEIQTLSGSRFLNGHVVRCEMIGRENSVSRYYIYRATVKPWLWYLTQTSDNKIFQQKSVPDVIKEVLSEYGFPFEMKLSASYRNWEYCVQYQETDFAFVSRLMEHEGIYYYFKHENGQHTLVMTDDIASHQSMSGYDAIPYYGPDRLGKPQEEYISMWEIAAQITPDGYATVDYDFTKPGASLDAVSRRSGGSQSGNLEMFEWQGGFQEADHGQQYSRIRLEELQSAKEQNRGISNARGIAPGYVFTLKNHPRSVENREYLVVSVNYRMSIAGYASGTDSEDFYEESFVALPSTVQYRAPRITPIPRTYGPQTARVVGPAGEEIWTDKYGRIKVQFHWDRYGKKNENSSCWVRVSSPWAGGGFGGLQLPRIKDEVVVDFIGGCPDRPLVLGRVYNDNNMPPVDLPGGASQSGFRSQSVHGDPSMANWLLFEDRLGAELTHMRAQLNMLLESNNDCDHHIGNNHTTTVGGCQHITVDRETHITRQGITNEELNAAVTRAINGDFKDSIVGEVTKNIQGSINRTHEGSNSNAHEGDDTSVQLGPVCRITVGPVCDVTLGPISRLTVGGVTNTAIGPQTTSIIGNTDSSYLGNLTSKVTGDRTSSVSGTATDTVAERVTVTEGTSTTEASTATAKYGSNTTRTGFNFAFNGYTFAANVRATTVGAISDFGYGLENRLLGTRTRAALAEQRLVGIEQNVKTVTQSCAGVHGVVEGMFNKMAGIRSHLGALTNRVSGLDSTL